MIPFELSATKSIDKFLYELQTYLASILPQYSDISASFIGDSIILEVTAFDRFFFAYIDVSFADGRQEPYYLDHAAWDNFIETLTPYILAESINKMLSGEAL